VDTLVRDREVGLEDGEHAGAAHALEGLRLADRICRGSRGHARHHRHAPSRRVQRHLDDAPSLLERQVRELAGRAQRREPVHARPNQVLDEACQHLVLDPPIFLDGRDQIGKDAVERLVH
jgi:hypothetical protein